jgi:hypothetical protein
MVSTPKKQLATDLGASPHCCSTTVPRENIQLNRRALRLNDLKFPDGLITVISRYSCGASCRVLYSVIIEDRADRKSGFEHCTFLIKSLPVPDKSVNLLSYSLSRCAEALVFLSYATD